MNTWMRWPVNKEKRGTLEKETKTKSAMIVSTNSPGSGRFIQDAVYGPEPPSGTLEGLAIPSEQLTIYSVTVPLGFVHDVVTLFIVTLSSSRFTTILGCAVAKMETPSFLSPLTVEIVKFAVTPAPTPSQVELIGVTLSLIVEGFAVPGEQVIL